MTIENLKEEKAVAFEIDLAMRASTSRPFQKWLARPLLVPPGFKEKYEKLNKCIDDFEGLRIEFKSEMINFFYDDEKKTYSPPNLRKFQKHIDKFERVKKEFKNEINRR